AMQDGAVLPLRFGTIFRDEDQLRGSLAPNASLFAKAIARAESRVEWDVKVVCDAGTLGAWIEGGNPRIAGLLAEATESGEGGAYLRRKRLDRAIAEEADRAREELGRVVHEALAACSEATAPAGAAGEPEPGGRVLVRADAYLVHRERSEEFRRAAGATETLLADRGVEVRITGPL